MSDHHVRIINDTFMRIIDYRIQEASDYLAEYEETPCTSFETVRAHEGMCKWYRSYIAALKKLKNLTTPRTTARILRLNTPEQETTDHDAIGDSNRPRGDGNEPDKSESNAGI